MNKTPERPRKNFNAYDRPLEWYRLPFAIKLAVLNLWRAEQASAPSSRGILRRRTMQQVQALRRSLELHFGPLTVVASIIGRVKGVVVLLLIVAIGIGVFA